jgi:signal transduction histidine kinase
MKSSWQRRAATRPRAVEASTLLLLFALTVVSVLVTRTFMPKAPSLWQAVALGGVACAVLPWRRRSPLRVLAVTTLCTMALGAVGYLLTPGLMGPVLATVNPAAWVLLSAALGAYVRVRREYAVARAEHADRQREEEARHRVIQERMRIARELHDVVAHHLTLADAQAATAAHLAHSRPEQAFDILARLPETTAAALRELKATVGLLRQDDDSSDLAPAPGLGRLPDLVDMCATVGLEVTVTVEGQRRPLPPVLDLTAYRIVQEALTNVTKHAATRTAEVRLVYTAHHLTLAVSNDTGADRPVAPTTSGGGFGLLGMRERAAAVGGTCHAGPRAQGGFEVACALPIHGPDRTDGFDHTDESPAS